MPLVGTDDAAASDDALIAAAQLGDERAFESLYRRYRADIKALCSRSLRDPHTTEDVTQETFLRAFRHIGEFERGRPVWPWLATIAKRLCIDELRGTTRHAALGRYVLDTADVVHDATSEEALALVERQRLNRVISGALAALRPRDRKVFVLQTIEGWSHERIAEQHGMSVHAVRNLAWRARRALRRSLGNERIRNWGWIFALRSRPGRRERAAPWRKWRLRSGVDVQLESTAVEWAAAIVLGLAAASATFFGGSAPSGRPSDAVVFRTVQAVPIPDSPTPSTNTSRLPNRKSHSDRSAAPPSIVAASVFIAGNDDGAAAPSGAKARVDVRAPDGRTLVWYENEASCGARASSVLPKAGPVTAVC